MLSNAREKNMRMATLTGTQPSRRNGLLAVLGALLAVFMVGCNLGATGETPVVLTTPTVPIVVPDNLGEGNQLASPTPNPGVPPTVTPTPEPLPAEKLGPITIDGTDHRTTEPVTVKVTRGKSVSNVTCSWVLAASNRTGTLSTPTSTPVDDNTFTDTYTFTPDAAGTYSVNCTGIATTAGGQRAVSSTGTPFAVEAKG
jgi:hypothetical protein